MAPKSDSGITSCPPMDSPLCLGIKMSFYCTTILNDQTNRLKAAQAEDVRQREKTFEQKDKGLPKISSTQGCLNQLSSRPSSQPVLSHPY